MIYSNQGKFDKALDYYQKSLRIFEQINNQDAIATCLTNIGVLYQDAKNYPLALEYYLNSLKIKEQIGDEDGIGICLTNIGNIYHQQKNYSLALQTYQAGLKLAEKTGDQLGISYAWSVIASTYLKTHQFTTAKIYADKGLKLAQKINALYYIVSNAKISFEVDSALGDWKSAFEHHKLYKQYSDSLHNEDKAKEFGRVESKYQFEKEAEEQKRKEAEAKRLAQIETERSNNLQYLSIFGGLMVLFGLLAFIGRFSIPVRVLDISLFATLLILFEFLLILFDPILDRYTGGIPIQKLIFNSVIALGFAPLHGFLEKKLRGRFVKASPN